MGLQHVEAAHQQVEQAIADAGVPGAIAGAFPGFVEQRGLVGEAAEAQQDRGAAGEAGARFGQRKAGGAGGR